MVPFSEIFYAYPKLWLYPKNRSHLCHKFTQWNKTILFLRYFKMSKLSSVKYSLIVPVQLLDCWKDIYCFFVNFFFLVTRQKWYQNIDNEVNNKNDSKTAGVSTYLHIIWRWRSVIEILKWPNHRNQKHKVNRLL